MRPELWTTLVDLMESVQPTGAAAEVLRVDRMEVDLPIDISFRGTGDDAVILGGAPRWRMPTAFDRPFGRLRMVLRPEVVAVLPTPAEPR
ncbi:MAG: hypothetical protein JWM27_1238 [Gemmatimonadetes bacterium]|nr:hypothetical protein [Gemmatimonadota bacterium]